jgi:hypothetical protein
MSTCGYICPQCGGTGLTDEGNDCDWCKPVDDSAVTNEEWLHSTHEGCGCSDDE